MTIVLKIHHQLQESSRLYDANYYVMNQNFDVYICIDNGSSGISTTGNASQDEPVFTDLEPSRAGESGDGYIWKYLFTVPPNDIINLIQLNIFLFLVNYQLLQPHKYNQLERMVIQP